jgi:hypothetical protein
MPPRTNSWHLAGVLLPKSRRTGNATGQHRWHDADEMAWEDRLLNVLVMYGYNE